MADLINKEYALASAVSGRTRLIDGERWIRVSEVRESIKNAPTIDAEPVKHGVIELTYEEYGELYSYALAYEQNHGEWLIDKSGSLMCSKCGTLLDEFQKPSRFCPNCGAKMDESTMGQVNSADAVNEVEE